MQYGVEQASIRIGADIIVVPSDYSDDVKEALFEGNACTILFKDNLTDEIKNIEGVSQTSGQLYLKTLSLSCCSASNIQIIALNPDTDFTVSAWMKNGEIENLGENEMIVGSACGLSEGEKITFFDKEFTVADTLEETGMGYDTSIFISYDTANEITSSPDYKDIFDEKTDLVSMILVNVSDDYEIKNVRRNISSKYYSNGISVYATNNLVENLSKQLNRFKNFGTVMNVFVILLSAVSIFSLVTLTFYRRRNRVGSLLSVGIGKRKIIRVFLTEYFYLTVSGAIAGILLVCIFVFPLHSVIKQILDIPYSFIGLKNMAFLMFKTLFVNIIIMLIGASFSFCKIISSEPSVLAEEQV
jgi:putative ABC transport system permease protein